MLRALFSATLAICLVAPTAQAQLWSQLPDGADGWNIAPGFDWSARNDFALGSASTVSGFRFWTLSPSPGTAVSWRVFADVAGTPDGLLGSGTAPLTTTGTGIFPLGAGAGERHVVDFSIGALALGAGTYWLELLDLTGGGSTAQFWETSSPVLGSGSVHTASGSAGAFDLAFEVVGSVATVPEPATAALALTGLALLGLRTRGRFRRA